MSSTPTADVQPGADQDFAGLVAAVRASFAVAADRGGPLFLTDAADLPNAYLDALPAGRQFHDCSCCRRFIETFGRLVTIGATGETRSAIWRADAVPAFYEAAVTALRTRVESARVTDLFRTRQRIWGTPATGPWHHLAVEPPVALVHQETFRTAFQSMAVAREDVRVVRDALGAYSPRALDEALRILRADALARSEKFVAPVAWLRKLHDLPKGRPGENLLRLATATAPAGYCHPRASVAGSLLDDIAAGMPFADIKGRFDAKLHPLRYQRPQAAPTAGNIAAAEALVAKLGLAPALERRFARLDELRLSWAPVRAEKPSPRGSVFGHLQPKVSAPAVPSVVLPPVTITWEKFARTVLPDSAAIELHVPATGRFIALTTAVHADAPPVLKWDRDDARNPVAWYVYPNGSPAEQWNLTAGGWAEVVGITPFPTLWGAPPMPFIAEGVILVLAGAQDAKSSGNALFPETLRTELHGIRATVEAYSRTATLAGREDAACGYDVRKSAAECRLRVLRASAWTEYRVDRWD